MVVNYIDKFAVQIVEEIQGFITNPDDLKAYHAGKQQLAKAHVDILIKYENMI
jgi:hypothetical protein